MRRKLSFFGQTIGDGGCELVRYVIQRGGSVEEITRDSLDPTRCGQLVRGAALHGGRSSLLTDGIAKEED